MKSTISDKQLAKKLLKLSFEGEGVSLARIQAIVQSLRDKPAHKRKPLLKLYCNYLLQEIGKTEGKLEYAGNVTNKDLQSLEKALKEYYVHDVSLTPVELPNLIAGFRITIGDDVWEASVSNNLKQLLTKTNF